jgi:hypothetical protein
MSPSSHEPDTPYSLTQRRDTFHDAQVIDGCNTTLLGSPLVSQGTATSRSIRRCAAEAARRPTPLKPDRLGFLPLADWDEYNSYKEDIPSRLRYSIEWKITVNNMVVAKDTEQDLVLVPAAYWHMYLKPKVEKLSSRKVAQNKHVEYVDTGDVVTVNDRSKRDLTKRFDNMDIDWSVVEKQLLWWGELFRAGKRLRIDLSFNYIDMSDYPLYQTFKLQQPEGRPFWSNKIHPRSQPAQRNVGTNAAHRPCRGCLLTEQFTLTRNKKQVGALRSGKKYMRLCDVRVLRAT